MTDKEWSEIINKSVHFLNKAFEMRKIAEEEYLKRFGAYPSDIDDDSWIDSVHYGIGTTNINILIENAKNTLKWRR